MKKILSLFMSMVMLISITAGLNLTANAEVLSGNCGAEGDGSNVTYTLDTDTGVLTISGTGDMYDYSFYNYVPWYSNRSLIKTVVINSGVTSIGDWAFYECSSLTSITIPDSVISIGNRAFDNTAYYNDESNWVDEVLYIDNAFIKAKTTISGDYTIKSGTTVIADRAFYDCDSLTSITIPNSVTSIGYCAFSSCSSLKSVTIGNSVKSIGNAAFEYCSSLTSITIPDSVTSIGSRAFEECISLTSVTIGNSVTSIGGSAFYHCYRLTRITIPDSVTSIGDRAFHNCTCLISVTIGNGVTSIGDRAFYVCSFLTSITVDRNNQYYSSQDGVLFNKDKTTLIQCPARNARTSYEIPNSVTSIGNWAFYECSKLTSITIPDSVTSIGGGTFSRCSSLKSVTIPDSVTSISSRAFTQCSSLTSITMPKSVTSIGDYAFGYCSSLTSITIPNDVTSIGYCAFSDCSSLKCVFYKGSEDEWRKISIGSSNDRLEKANIHYNSKDSDGYKPHEIVESSCNQGGYTVYKCSICGNSYNADNTAKLGHSFKNYVSDNNATCTSDGTKTAKCDRCDARKTITVAGSALGHSFTNYESNGDATCTEDGTKTAKCDRCDKTDTVVDVDSALGHSFTNYVSDNNATCTSDGTKTAKCDRCDARDTITSVGTAFGHNFNGGKSCVVCGAVNPNYVEPPTPTQPATTAPAQPTTQAKQEETTEKETTTKPASVKVGKTVYKSDKNGDYVSTKVKKPAVSKVTNTKKSIKITWKKVDAVSGYEVEYSTDKKFKKDVKTATVKGNKAKNPSVTLKNLKSNKTYYVRIRTYKTTKVNGEKTKVYSSWSKVKSVKTK